MSKGKEEQRIIESPAVTDKGGWKDDEMLHFAMWDYPSL